MDADGITESRGAAPLLELIRKVGGWNITSGNFSAATWDFQNMLQQLQNEYNVSPLFSWSVVEDDKNSSSYVIQVRKLAPNTSYSTAKSIRLRGVCPCCDTRPDITPSLGFTSRDSPSTNTRP